MDRRVLREARDAAGWRAAARDHRGAHGARPGPARGTLGGRPVAVSSKRSTYMKELDAGGLDPQDEPQPGARPADDFVDIFARVAQPLDQLELRQRRGDRLRARRPLPAPARERSTRTCPVWGTGEWEWADGRPGQRPLPRPRRGAARGGAAAGLLRVVEQPAGARLGRVGRPVGLELALPGRACSRTRSWPRSPARSTRSAWCR